MTLDPVVPGRHVRLAYALAALGCAAFTLYGSLVPFAFTARGLDDALGAFEWAVTRRPGIQSRGDWLANCLLGLPLGFFLVGSLRVRASRGAGDWLAAAGAVVAGGLFATGVEFAQLFVPGRTCSASDIIAQTLGSVAGAAGWLIAGPMLTRRTRELWADPRSGGAVGQLLLGYALFVLLVQTLPLDLLTSPREVYHKLRASDGTITLVPFADFPGDDPWKRVQTWLELVGLFLPAGLLASRFPRAGTWTRTEVFGAGVVFALLTEAAQVLVSRHPSATDVLVGGAGVLAGFLAGRGDRRAVPLLLGAWLLVLAVTHWQPFRFALPTGGGPSWLPFADAQRQEYLTAFDGLFARGVMFAPVGVAVVRAGKPVWLGAVAGFTVAVLLEAGQAFVPGRTSATTELVLGPAGALAGAVAAGRLVGAGSGELPLAGTRSLRRVERTVRGDLTVPETPRRWLFFKERFAWPRASGHDVHTYYLMRALVEQGHAVAVATSDAAPPEALAGVGFASRFVLNDMDDPGPDRFPLRFSRSQAKFASYWGTPEASVRKLAAAAAESNADVVVVSGLNVLPYLGAVDGPARVWYAADEWVWHHASQAKLLRPRTWGELKQGLVKGLYERAFRGMLDRVWVVSEADARAFRWLAGIPQTDILPNGVDADHYAPDPAAEVEPNSCAFWGRLDFGPNVQAVEHFVGRVWPAVRATVPDARFRLYGFQPVPAVERLAGRDGITLTPDLPDIRPAARAAGAVVLPFVSGGGIKNKLLEACALGVPVVATPRTVAGLPTRPAVAVADKPADWARALKLFWADPGERASVAAAGRAWVVEHHTWGAAARTAAAGLARGGAA